MLLHRATVSNVSRALREIQAFEWEGEYKPMARQALKEIIERGFRQELVEFLGVDSHERSSYRTD